MCSFLNLKEEYSQTVVYHRKNPPSTKTPDTNNESHLSLKSAALSIPFLLTPVVASASTFDDMHRSIMNLFDGGVVLILIFAGGCWALGHRGKAIEITIGVCCGYLLARHAVNIRDYLKGIGG